MDSLLDDPAFVAALEKLDLPTHNPAPGEFGHRRTLAEWAQQEGLILEPPDDSFASFVAPQPVGARRAMTAATFLTLMFVGGAAAAVVFQDRVFRILATL